MAILGAMGNERKTKWNHRWIADGLTAAGKDKKDLAKLLGIHPGGVTRLLKGDRALKEPEAVKIRNWFKALTGRADETAQIVMEDSPKRAQTPNGDSKENSFSGGEAMGSDDALRMLVKQLQIDLNDLRERFAKTEELRREPPGHPRKGRGGT